MNEKVDKTMHGLFMTDAEMAENKKWIQEIYHGGEDVSVEVMLRRSLLAQHSMPIDGAVFMVNLLLDTLGFNQQDKELPFKKFKGNLDELSLLREKDKQTEFVSLSEIVKERDNLRDREDKFLDEIIKGKEEREALREMIEAKDGLLLAHACQDKDMIKDAHARIRKLGGKDEW